MRAARGWIVAELVLAIGLVLFFAFMTLGGVLVMADSGADGWSIGFTAACVVLALLCVWWAIHAEHRLRTTPARVHPRVHHSGKHSPVAATLGLLFVVAIAAVSWGALTAAHGDASRSARVQHHGIAATGTVVSVQNTVHHSRSGRTSYSALLDVRLDQPVSGTAVTVVHYSHRNTRQVGDTVDVLVDPHDPRYAELPGKPTATTGQWVGALVFAILMTIAAGFAARAWVRALIRRRAGRLAPAGQAR